ncbi:MAG: PAS domain S-box protein [Syntrophus sp. (in: bacteria)]
MNSKVGPNKNITYAFYLVILIVSTITMFLGIRYSLMEGNERVNRIVTTNIGDIETSFTKDTGTVIRTLAENIIRQRAEKVATDIENYIIRNPRLTVADLQKDSRFKSIALQPVGKTGYTAVHEANTSINRFHVNPEIINNTLSGLAHEFPDFWKIIKESRGIKESGGYYQWREADGRMREKFMWLASASRPTADGAILTVAATTYIDEFLEPQTHLSEKFHKEINATSAKIKISSDITQRRTIVAIILIILLFSCIIGYMAFQLVQGYHRIKKEMEERKQLEAELMESEERFRKLFADSTDASLIIYGNRFVDCNRAAIAMLRMTSKEEVLDTHPSALSPEHQPDGRLSSEKADEMIRLAFSDSNNKFEWMHRRADGEEFPVEVLLTPIYHRNKSLLFVVWRDITDRKQVEKELKASENKYRSIFNNAVEGIYQTTPEGRYRSINPAFALMFGYDSPNEMVSSITNIGEQLYVDPGDRTRLIEMMRLSKGMVRDFHVQLKRKDGSLFWVSINARIINDERENLPFLEGTCMDITDRIMADEQLRESQQRLSDIIEFLPDATLVIDKNGEVIAWNRTIETMTGIKKEDMIGKGNYEYALPFYGDRRPILIDLALHPDKDLERQYTAIQRMGDILFGESFTPTLPPGDVHLSATASVLRDARGEIIAAIECIRNNTELKRLEESLNRAEKMESLGRLAGGVAHDLNNVLGVLVGYSELLLQKLSEESPLRRYADTILQSSMKGAAIIQDLLTLARRGVTVSDVINLNKVIFDYLKTPEFEKLKSHHQNVKIWAEPEDGLLNIKGSPIHLEKTLMNLVSNAAESISGQGELTIRTENRYLDQPIRGYDEIKDGDYVALIVSDTGSGISSQDIGKIFEPFYTKKVMGRSGTGLGLAVVWGTLKDHNGYIDVQSEEGKGTTFTLYFPITREDLAKEKDAVLSSIYKGRGESILVVDDVKEQRELAMSILGWLGYQVEALSSGEEAIDYLQSKKADLVVLDMIMEPGIDGLETYKRIIEVTPRQKAIIVSGFSETDRVKKALEIGAGSFVRKPYVLEKMGLAVRNELDKK